MSRNWTVLFSIWSTFPVVGLTIEICPFVKVSDLTCGASVVDDIMSFSVCVAAKISSEKSPIAKEG